VIHSQKERRYRCKRCGRTFPETQGTALYRVHKPKWLVLTVVTLFAYGCPVQAIFAAFGLDERTAWPAGKRNPACSAGEYMRAPH
jgi:transposase-like protein